MKKTLLALAAATLSMNALANGYIELDIAHISAEEGSLDFDQQAIATHIGYNFTPDSAFQHKAEVFLGLGLGEDTILGTDVDIRYYYGVAYRPTYHINQDWEVYARLTRAKAEIKINDISTTSDAENGWGVGVGYQNFTLSYTDIDDTKFINAGYTFKF